MNKEKTQSRMGRVPKRKSGPPIIRQITTLALAGVAGSAMAYEPTTTLGSLGATENQQRAGDAVQTVCGQFASGSIPVTNALEQDLFDRCRAMVHTANSIAGGAGATADSLSLNAEDLGNVVMTVAAEELAATNAVARDMSAGQSRIATARLQAVRAGNRFGFTGNGITNMADASSSYSGERGGAAGDLFSGPWGFFANIEGGFGDRDRTDNEDGFDYDSWGFDVGMDYRVTPNFIVGGLVNYRNGEVDFDDISTAPGIASIPGGGIDSDAFGIGAYGTYYADNYYIDGLIGYMRTSFDTKRTIYLPDAVNPANTVIRTAKGDTDSDGFQASVGGGMDFARGNLTYGPYGRLEYNYTDVDGYTESGALGLNLEVDSQDWESLTSVIGGRFSYSYSTSWGVLVPQGRLGWVHEFMNDSQKMSAIYAVDPGRNELISITDDPDRNYFELGLGVSTVAPNGMQVFFDYQTLLGHEYFNDHRFTLGVRGEFE